MNSIGSMIGNNVAIKASESATKMLKEVIKEQLKTEKYEILRKQAEYPDLLECLREGWILAENKNDYVFKVLAPKNMFGKIVLKDRNAVITESYKSSVLVKLGDVWEFKSRSGKVLMLAREVFAVKESEQQIKVKALKNKNNSSVIAFYKSRIVRFLGTMPNDGEVVTCKVFGYYENNLYVTL